MKTEKNYSSLTKDNSQFTHPLPPSPNRGWGKISSVDIKNCKATFTLAEGATHVAPSKACRRGAFTLAEVLITLAVVGIVAALTMPGLIVKYQKRVVVQKLKSTYSLISEAIKVSESINGEISTWNHLLSGEKFFDEYLKGYLSVVKVYKTNTELNKIVTHKTRNNFRLDGYYGRNACHYLLSNGVMLSIYNRREQERTANNFAIVVDVNGIKKPNTVGYDTFFAFKIYPTGIVLEPIGNVSFSPNLTLKEKREFLLNDTNFDRGCKRAGYQCLYLIILDGWEIKDDYPW